MAQLLMSEKKYADANKRFEQALSKNPRDIQAIGGLTQLLLIQKEPTQAAARVRQQIEKAPDTASLYLLLGQVEIVQKDYKAAEGTLHKALELDPKHIDARLALAPGANSVGSAYRAAAAND